KGKAGKIGREGHRSQPLWILPHCQTIYEEDRRICRHPKNNGPNRLAGDKHIYLVFLNDTQSNRILLSPKGIHHRQQSFWVTVIGRRHYAEWSEVENGRAELIGRGLDNGLQVRIRTCIEIA